MFKIKWRKKDRQTQPTDPTKLIAYSALKAAVLHTRWQEILGQCVVIPNQRAAITPLVQAVLSPPISDLIAHAKEYDLITTEQAEELIKGHVGTFDFELKEGL